MELMGTNTNFSCPIKSFFLYKALVILKASDYSVQPLQ